MKNGALGVLVLLLLLGGGCAQTGQVSAISGEAVTWRRSPNFDARRPNFVIVHQTTSDNAEHALATLTDPERKVSAHYLIGRDGRVVALVDESRRAWHAGVSRWGMLTDLNSASIGIELDNNGNEPFAEAQIEALIALLRDITRRHAIPPGNVLAHGDIAPRRKVDPGRLFPWRRLAEAGFGLWCDAPAPAPAGFDTRLALQALGYDLSDPVAAALAFRRHFGGDDASPELTAADRAMLACLIERRDQGAS